MTDSIPWKNLTSLEFETQLHENNDQFVRGYVVSITNVLSSAVNLEKLSLQVVRFSAVESLDPWPIENHQQVLFRLQWAFRKLESLRELRFKGIFIHPSFFVPPPPGVKILKYKCYTTPTWWAGFSKCRFEGVEELVLACKDATRWWDQADYENVRGVHWARGGDGPFDLDGVAFTGLKEFKARLSPSGPSNIFGLVMESNLGLSARSVQEALRNHETECLTRAMESLNKAESWLAQ
ncbi:hypothetical protein TWF481_011346 [Arthrobotrys musiformis]